MHPKRAAAVAIALIGAILPAQAAAATEENSRYQAGVTAGFGSYTYIDNPNYRRAVVGVEVCAHCGSRYALFADYRHFLAPGAPSRYKSADLAGAGLRIQGRRRVSAFFDAGFAAGSARFQWGNGTRSINTAGAGLGAGVAIRAGRSVYVRPQFRLYVMSQAYIAGTVEVAAGWRF